LGSSIEPVPVFGTRVEGCPYVHRPSAYALLRDAQGRLAVTRTARGCYLPGGGIEAGESPAQALEREAREECGLVIAAGAVLARALQIVYSSRERTCFEKDSLFLTGTILDQVPAEEPDHELLWLAAAAAVEMLSYESQRWVVRRFFDKPP
jgi:8-oxo-dGTP diphosphatase